MKDIQHLVRAAAVFLLGFVAFLVVRSFLIAPSFGKIGHYRAAAVDDVKASPVRYGGRKASCAKCHAAQAKAQTNSAHRGASCETCHGALHAHELDPKASKASRPGRGDMRAFCLLCHEAASSKPKGFPQIHDAAHNPGLPCTGCHNPHSPKP